MGSTAASYLSTAEEITLVLLKLFHKTEKEGKLSNSFYEANITMIPSQIRTQQRRKLYTNFLDEPDIKILNKIPVN
jgi:hypothetical protein